MEFYENEEQSECKKKLDKEEEMMEMCENENQCECKKTGRRRSEDGNVR